MATPDPDSRAADAKAADAIMQTLVSRFVERCGADAAELRRLAHEAGSLSRTTSQDRILTIAHSLAGSASTFGHPEVSRLAARLEDSLRENEAPGVVEPLLLALLSQLEGLGDPMRAR